MKQKLRKQRLYFPSSSGKADIEAVVWYPPIEPRAVLMLVHGMQEHVERYDQLAQFLTRVGFLVCGHNQLGHGGSLIDHEGGIFPAASSTRYLVEDCRRFLSVVRREFPDLPIFLMGHSFGSFVSREALTDPAFSKLLRGAILSGTADVNPGLRLFALPTTRILSLLCGHRRQSRSYERLANHAFARYFPGENSPHRWVSSLPEEVEAFDQDPKMGFVFSLGGYQTVLETLNGVSGSRWAKKIDPALSILLISGEDDPVGEKGKGVRRVATSLLQAGMRDLTLHLEPNARHELLREPCRQQIMQLILDWMERRI